MNLELFKGLLASSILCRVVSDLGKLSNDIFLLFNPLMPTIYILFLSCATPKYLELRTLYDTLYPNSYNVFIITFRVLPLSCVTRPSTFSNIKPIGFFISNMFATLKNKVPLVSANPNPLPAELNAWQGKPPNKISKSGMEEGSILVISPTIASSVLILLLLHLLFQT